MVVAGTFFTSSKSRFGIFSLSEASKGNLIYSADYDLKVYFRFDYRTRGTTLGFGSCPVKLVQPEGSFGVFEATFYLLG